MLSENDKGLIRRALESHQHCAHTSAELCFSLVLLEAEIQRDKEFYEDEVQECRTIIADSILESLILKGHIEATGIDESGEFYLGLTDLGEAAYQNIINPKKEGI